MRVAVLSVILLIVASVAAFAGALKNEKDARNLTDSIMSSVAKGDLKGAFDKMKPYVPISETEVDAAYLQSKSQRDQAQNRFGKSNSYEFIDSKSVGTSLFRIRYIEKTTKHALPWSFYFYRTGGIWTLNVFNWNDRFPELFD